MKTVHDLSIIIVNRNTQKLLDICLLSIFNNKSLYDIECILVDNASTDGSVEMIKRRYPQVKLIENKTNMGFAKANNIGYKISNGRNIMYLNSDTIVRPHSIDKLIDFLDKTPEAKIVGPKLLNEDGSLQISAFKLPNLFNSVSDLILGFFNSPFLNIFSSKYPNYNKVMKVGWLSGACLVARRTAIDRIGGWDERFFMYSEDILIGIKAKELSLTTIYFPEAEIYHLRGKSSKSSHERVIQVYTSRIKLRKMYFSKPALAIYLIFTSFITFGRAITYLFIASVKYLFGRPVSFELDKKMIYLKLTSMHLKAIVENWH